MAEQAARERVLGLAPPPGSPELGMTVEASEILSMDAGSLR